jgi:hypothetical protein
MPGALPACPNTAGSCSEPSTHAGRFDGVVVVASTFVIGNFVLKVLKICSKFSLFDHICIAIIEARITFIARDIEALEVKVGIHSNEQSVQPPVVMSH